MKHNDTQKYGSALKALSTERLERVLSNLLQEMRRRDSQHIKDDVLASSKALRMLRSTGKLAGQ